MQPDIMKPCELLCQIAGNMLYSDYYGYAPFEAIVYNNNTKRQWGTCINIDYRGKREITRHFSLNHFIRQCCENIHTCRAKYWGKQDIELDDCESHFTNMGIDYTKYYTNHAKR